MCLCSIEVLLPVIGQQSTCEHFYSEQVIQSVVEVHLTLNGTGRHGALCHPGQLVQQTCTVRDGEEHRPLMLLLLSGHGQRPVRDDIGGLLPCWHHQHLWPTPVVILDDRLQLPGGDGGVGEGEGLAAAAAHCCLEVQGGGLGLSLTASPCQGEEAVLTTLHLASHLWHAAGIEASHGACDFTLDRPRA